MKPSEVGIYVVYFQSQQDPTIQICYGWQPCMNDWYECIWLVPGTEEC